MTTEEMKALPVGTLVKRGRRVYEKVPSFRDNFVTCRFRLRLKDGTLGVCSYSFYSNEIISFSLPKSAEPPNA